MLKHLLQVSFRHLRRQNLLSAVNVVALAAGVLACLLVAALVRHELAYDRFHAHADRLHRVTRTAVDSSGTEETTARMPPNFADLSEQVPGVEHVVRFGGFTFPAQYSGSSQPAVYLDVLSADEEVFDAFSFELARGNPETALATPSSIVLTKEAAQRVFGSADPVGETVLAGGQLPLTVTGVLDPVPEQSSIRFDGLLSFSTHYDAFDLGEAEEQVRQGVAWLEQFHTYVLLAPRASKETVEKQLASYVASLTPFEEVRQSTFRLESITDIYLYGTADHLGPTGNARLTYVALTAALLVLGLAIFNYATLSTVQAAQRAREVGVRKVFGSHRLQLMNQFFLESCVLSVGAFALAALLAGALLPVFNAAVGRPLSYQELFAPAVLVALLALALAAGVLAAVYPAFFLARLAPASALRGKASQLPSMHAFRKGAVGAQFFVTGVLLVFAVTAQRQTAFIAEQDAGLPGDRLLVIDAPMPVGQAEVLRQSLQARPFVQHAALTSGVPFAAHGGSHSVNIRGTNRTVNNWRVSPGFIETLGLRVLVSSAPAGAPFAGGGVYVNEALARMASWDNPIGQMLNERPVVGVVENFHFESLHRRVAPLVLSPLRADDDSTSTALLVFQLASGSQDPLPEIGAEWQDQFSSLPFSYFYVGQKYDALHRDDRRFARLLLIVLGFALAIACTGLFAIAAHTTEQRRKEIAIRKVLGASFADVTALFAKELAVTVGLAVLLALPAAYLLAERWLSSFAYHVSVGAWTLLLCSALALVVAIVAVGYHVVRAARADPVRSIRQE